MRPKTNVLFATSVIQDLKYYRGGLKELQSIETMLEDHPLYGLEYYEDIPSIRYFNKSFANTALGCSYLYLPAADFIARANQDEILVLTMGGPIWRPQPRPVLTPHQKQEILRVVVEIYHTTKDTV